MGGCNHGSGASQRWLRAFLEVGTVRPEKTRRQCPVEESSVTLQFQRLGFTSFIGAYWCVNLRCSIQEWPTLKLAAGKEG